MLEHLNLIQGLLVRGRPEGVHVVGPPGGGVLLHSCKNMDALAGSLPDIFGLVRRFFGTY